MTLLSTNDSPDSSTNQAESTRPQPPPQAKILRLNATAYLAFHNWADAKDQHCNPVHFAQIHHPTHGRSDVCVKVFPIKGTGRRGLLNEITGWLLTNAAGVPQPGFACVLNLPLDKVKAPKGWLRDQIKAGITTWPAFCAERLPWQSAAVQFSSIDSQVLLRELQQWTHNALMTAVDEQLGYADRHFNNLLRSAPNTFWAIDFDRLACEPGTPDWTIESLTPTRHYDNQLSRRLWGDRPGNSLSSQIVAHGEELELRYATVEQELKFWGKSLLANPAEQRHWLTFIERRATLVAWLLQRRYGLLSDATLH